MGATTLPTKRDEVTQMSSEDRFSIDLERKGTLEVHLQNTTVKDFLWKNVSVTVKSRETKLPIRIIDDVSGVVAAGELCALMGPSGCGKTTLLNVLARREVSAAAKIEGSHLVNGTDPSLVAFQKLTSYVEQDDALIGSLTVRETMNFAARLSPTQGLSKTERMRRIDDLIDAFGLRKQEKQIIGTPIRKGISGGQKRRVSVASQLITDPKILFLDEPTSGLDSAASWEVMSYIRGVAKRNNLIVIASIHQPSTSTFQLFDKLLLLSGGKSYYFGPVKEVGTQFASAGFPMPAQINPAEFILELMNTDFTANQERAQEKLERLHKQWMTSPESNSMIERAESIIKSPGETIHTPKESRANFFAVTLALLHRSFIKSYRDVVAYGIRIAMYFGLAVMMGTVWLRLKSDQASIIPVTNAIFFGSAFMSFMAVAYVPAFLEDRSTFVKERANGLYGASAFMVANFLIGLPYLFFISCLFSVIAYWLSGFQPTASAFFTWVMWLFLDLVAAESLVVLMSSLFPIFVISLALTAFANGLWMCVDGFMVPPKVLNVFWKYVFSYIDYQSYVFQGMMVNEFQHRTYTCGTSCHCMYESDLNSQCMVRGLDVLDDYGYATGRTGKWVGFLLLIVLGYRLLGLAALHFRK